MPLELFSRSELSLAKPATMYRTPRCGVCGLHKGCRSPKMKMAGQGRKGIMVVGEAPGQEEDEHGVPFVGKTGQLLQRTLRNCEIDLFRDCWALNSARCRPPRNELPDKSIDYCRPYVIRDIEELKPTVIILLGKAAIRSVLGYLGQSDTDTSTVARWAGFRIPSQSINAWVCPTYHPSFVLRSLDEKRGTGQVIEADFNRHLAAACSKTQRPWKEVPDWSKEVEVILDAGRAAEAVAGFNTPGRLISWDIETTTSKPDGPHAEIVCCSVSDGRITIAFPWHGRVIREMVRLLVNPFVRKMGQNIKFETRYLKAKLGIQVRGWVFDDMITSHCLDSRRGITGLAFQSFARLGMPDYKGRFDSYLRAEGGNTKNRIRECDITELCRYCGTDSLVEFKLGKLQAKEMGIKL